MAELKHFDVIVIGGGQSGLSVGYYLRRTQLNYIILDDQQTGGGAWQHGWDSLKLFSPAEHSSLPGWLMPKATEEYPGRDHVINYLIEYETRYKLNIKRPVSVQDVTKKHDQYLVATSDGLYSCHCVVSATGTWSKPHIPTYPGRQSFTGLQIHSAHYQSPDLFKNKKVMIVGGGNSAAQILAEVSKVASTTWATLNTPRFLPDEVDGRYLFEFATKQYMAKLEGKTITPAGSLGDIVMTESVKAAHAREVYESRDPFTAIYSDGVVWPDHTKESYDAIIWCTGFKSSLDHLAGLNITEHGKIETLETKAINTSGLWLVGYGSWTGYASATLIGVGRTARTTVRQIQDHMTSIA